MASKVVCALALAALALAPLAHAGTPTALRAELSFDQNLDAVLPNVALTDESGRVANFSTLLAGRPAILVFAYYRCPNLCTLVLNGLAESLKQLHLELGKDYQVLTLSIDPREKPPLAKAKMRSYLARLGTTAAHFPNGSPWHFLTASQVEIRSLTQAAGFHYRYDLGADEFLHPSGIVILTPQGKISRYFFGIDFPAAKLESALKAAADDKVGSLAERILLYCLHFDPRSSKTTERVILWLRVVSMLSLIVLGLFIARLALREEKQR